MRTWRRIRPSTWAWLIGCAVWVGVASGCESSSSSSSSGESTSSSPSVSSEMAQAGGIATSSSPGGESLDEAEGDEESVEEGEAVELDDLGALEIDGAMIEVDGLLLHQMRCELEGAGGMAMVDVVAHLSEHKAALDACAPGGAAYRVAVRWSPEVEGGDVQITAASGPDSGAVCLDEVLSAIAVSDYSGRCSALMLVGERSVAEDAASRLMGDGADAE